MPIPLLHCMLPVKKIKIKYGGVFVRTCVYACVCACVWVRVCVGACLRVFVCACVLV